ncbi:MAG TPA: LysR family transcriptional regulator [Polyangiaceae bacterium]|nr:LysR family transcriptional regulator [Polyangiaceae bacterium]
MLDGVTIEQLRTFLAVVEAGSFSGAARTLGRVQAGVSQSMDRLEAQLGLRLFDRTGRVPVLTEHGHAVLGAAKRVEGEVGALDELVASLKRGEETSLRIVVDVLFPTEALVAFAEEFGVAHPSVELVLFTEVLSAVTAHVREKRSSWGIALEDAELDGLDQRAIASVQLVPVAAPKHPLTRRPAPLGAAALADAVQIVLGEHRNADERDPDDHGVLSARTWRVVDLATKHAFIASGLGWGHLPEHLVRDDLQDGRLVRLDLEAWGSEPLRRSLVLVRRSEGVLGPVARWAIDRLGALCRARVETADLQK